MIDATLKHLAAPKRVGVIVINPAAQRDAARLRPHCKHVEWIDASVPRATQILNAISKMPLTELDLILIEACGGLAPLEDLGQGTTVAAFAVGGGDDKAAEYRALLQNSSAVLLTQIDMQPLVKFNEHVFRCDVQSVDPAIAIFELSAVSGAGMYGWMGWLERTLAAKKRRGAPLDAEKPTGDCFLG